MTVMKIAASFCSQQETRFAFGVTFIVMAGPVPAISRGTVPLRMAGTSPAMTVQVGFIQGELATAGVNSQ